MVWALSGPVLDVGVLPERRRNVDVVQASKDDSKSLTIACVGTGLGIAVGSGVGTGVVGTGVVVGSGVGSGVVGTDVVGGGDGCFAPGGGARRGREVWAVNNQKDMNGETAAPRRW